MKLTHSDIAGLCRRLALLLHAGIGIADGIFLLAEEEEGTMRTLLQTMGSAMDAGKPLAKAMEESGAFPVSLTGMVRAAERSGRMEEVMTSLSEFYEQRSRTDRKLRRAVAYPGMILILMLVVVGVLLVKVLPVFDAVYASLGSGLTGVAAGLLHAGTLLKQALPMLFALLAAAAALIIACRCSGAMGEKLHSWYKTRFGDKGISRKFNNANFARALAMGLGSALPLEEALGQAGCLLADIPGAAARCSRCAQALHRGENLSEAMGAAGFLSPAQSRMLSVGLRQGSGDLVMEEIARQLLDDANESLENLAARAEPAMVLTASVLVGLILLAVMLPLMDIMAAIG